MHTRLLNMGFVKMPGNIYVCEDVRIEIKEDKIVILSLNVEVTIDELEKLMLDD